MVENGVFLVLRCKVVTCNTLCLNKRNSKTKNQLLFVFLTVGHSVSMAMDF